MLSHQFAESCIEKITDLLPALKEEFRDAIESLAQASNTEIDMSDMMQKLLSNVLENVVVFFLHEHLTFILSNKQLFFW